MAETLQTLRSLHPRPPEAVAEHRSLVRLLERHGPAEGINTTALPGVEVTRASRPRPRAPVVSQPALCIVAQGSKRAYLGGEAYGYDPFHYLVLSVPLAIEGQIVEASPEKPCITSSAR